jgi:DNA-binding CsgD family transcriptional regulator
MGTSDLDRFAGQLAAARSFDAALDLLANEVRELGFVGVDYAVLPAARVLDGRWAAGPIFERNFPTGWRTGWRLRGRSDPILPTSYRKGLPVDWQVIGRDTRLTAAEREALDFLAGMGFPGGITVPIHLPANRFAFVSAVSSAVDEEWEGLSARAMAPLMVLAHTFHHVLAVCQGARHATASVLLTRREIECLQAAACGHNAPATARLINRSVDTVRLHLKNTMAKLGARTIAQSVAIGAACGLIDVGELTSPPELPDIDCRRLPASKPT